MRRLTYLLLILVIVAAAMGFGELNSDPVTVDFLLIEIPGWPLGFWLIAFLLAGMLVAGVLVWVQLWFSLRRRLKAMQREHDRRTTGSGRRDIATAPPGADDHG